MKTSYFHALAGALLVLAPAGAFAAPVRFEIRGVASNPFSYTFSFVLDDATRPNPVTSTSARFNGTVITYTRPGSTTPFIENGQFDGPTFFTTLDQGGIGLARFDREQIQNQQFRLFNQQLFTGPTSAPVFTRGTFLLASTPRNGGDPVQPITYQLTISDVAIASAVPEPATWAMMLVGFGTVGSALRSRRRRASAAAVA